jgi:paraquat-inducible protein B
VTDEVPTNGGSEASSEASPPLRQSARQRISLVWTIPVIALLLGALLVVQTYLDQGPTIEIRFAAARGLKAGATPIKLLEVEVGLVTEVRLNDDLDGIVAVAELDPSAKPYLREGTVFWLVRPQLSLAGVSALETLISGQYIEVVPSREGERRSSFEGQLNPPIGARYPNGKTIVLETDRLGSISQGTPVFHRNIRAGEVEHYELGEADGPILVRLVIDQAFAARVRETSLFWNASGIDAQVGFDGIKVRTEGLAAVVAGGIAFSSRDDDAPEAENGATFVLHDGADAAQQAQQRSQSLVVWLETRDGQGLSDGTPIHYRGAVIGQIGGSRLTSDAKAVRIKAYIEPRYQSLVREGSRFYQVSGVDLEVGLDGVKVRSATLASIATGGVSLATPDPPGDRARWGALFALHDEPDEAWLAWQPVIALGRQPRGGKVEHQLPPLGWQATAFRVLLIARAADSLSEGDPVLYRGLKVGELAAPRFGPNNSEVWVDALIESQHAMLVRDNTQFWNASGIAVDVGLGGIEIETGAFDTVLRGGVQMATPDPPAARAVPGRRFTLLDAPEGKWQEWAPALR